MKKHIAFVTAAALGLAACSGGAALTGAKLSQLLQLPAASSLVTQIETGFGPAAQNVLNKVNAGFQVVEQDKKYLCAGMSMADGLFRIAASIPDLVPADDVWTEGASMFGANALCAAATDLPNAVAQLARGYVDTTQALVKAGALPVSAAPMVGAGS